MVAAVEAGLGLNAALNRVADELKVLHPDMHYEMDMVNLEILRPSAAARKHCVPIWRKELSHDIRVFRSSAHPSRSVWVFTRKQCASLLESLRNQTTPADDREQAAQKAALSCCFHSRCFCFRNYYGGAGIRAANIIDILFK